MIRVDVISWLALAGLGAGLAGITLIGREVVRTRGWPDLREQPGLGLGFAGWLILGSVVIQVVSIILAFTG